MCVEHEVVTLLLDAEHWWTSANDRAVEGHWVWHQNNLPMDIPIWKGINPNDANRGEDCGELQPGLPPGLNDASCKLKLFAICEYAAHNASTP